MNEETLTTERQDSIKISKGMNGKYSFEVKRYYDFTSIEPKTIIKQIQQIDNELKKSFGGSDVE